MLFSAALRAAWGKNDALRDAGLTTPPDIVRYDDIPYGKDPKWQALDVYRPREAAGNALPVIVSVHGGGWVYGDKELYQYYCMSLAQRGFAVVNFTYRLAPEFQFPAQLEDTCSVFSWVLANARAYGFDAGRVFAVGDSAGAQLLGLFTGLCTDGSYRRRFSFRPPKDFVPAGIALNCGVYRASLAGLGLPIARELLPHKGTRRERALLDVLNRVNSRFPPTFLMTCTGDFLEAEAAPMAERLRKAQIPFVFRYWGDQAHQLGHVFHCNMKSEAARLCNDEECAFFRRLTEE